MNEWKLIWHQALTCSPKHGKVVGKDKTIIFTVHTPASATGLRIRFTNRLGEAPYQIGRMAVAVRESLYPVKREGKTEFEIPVGETVWSDALPIDLEAGEDIEIRMYFESDIADCNMIEEEAHLYMGDHVYGATEAAKESNFAKRTGIFPPVPAIEAVEIQTEEELSAIVAFGDSITAMSRWTKPLSARLEQAYQGKYALLNSGISGNCLLYKVPGMLGDLFGDEGVKRFQQDVLDVPNLKAVIIALGVNDVSYLTKKTAGLINKETFIQEVQKITQTLHERGVRVVMQTISPRLGVARRMGKYTQAMEDLRLELNDWIRSASMFDYVFDAEAVVSEEHKDGLYYKEGLHQGDHLHPNFEGGRVLAEAYDLDQLTGRFSVCQISGPEEKSRIARIVLEALQEWFEVPETREGYIRDSANWPFFAAFVEDRPVGFLCLKETGKATVELAVMGVLKEYHRYGIGRALFHKARQSAAEQGYEFLQVKTVQMGCYEDYDATNRFYQALGFKEFEVMPMFWDEANPCQIYVMHLKGESENE